MGYRVELLPSARRELGDAPVAVRRRIGSAIEALAVDPRPPGARLLRGSDDLFRIRVGDYRVVYRVEEETVTVLVVRIGHRRDVYRRLAETLADYGAPGAAPLGR